MQGCLWPGTGSLVARPHAESSCDAGTCVPWENGLKSRAGRGTRHCLPAEGWGNWVA